MEEVRRRLQLFLTLFVLVTVIGTAGFMVLEQISFADAFYYNIVTMSTVGYGDIHPTSQASRMFAVLLIVMGGATFLGVIANGSEILRLRRESQNRRRVGCSYGASQKRVSLPFFHCIANQPI